MTNENFINKLKLISDPTRLTILQMLSKNGTMCGCKILEELNITQGTLSHHMKLLTENGIVTCIKDGKWCNYTLINESICELSKFLKDICSTKSESNCSCGCNN